MFSPGDEPTALIKVFGDFNTRIQSVSTSNRSGSTSGIAQSNSSSVQQRLEFDDSVFFHMPSNDDDSQARRNLKRTMSLSSGHQPSLIARGKQPRLEISDFEATPPQSSKKHYPTQDEYAALQAELEKTKMALIRKEAEFFEAQTAIKKSEDYVSKIEFASRREKIDAEESLLKIRQENRELKDQILDLKENISDLKKRSDDKKEDFDDFKHNSIKGRNALEDRCAELSEENLQLQEELINVQRALNVYQEEESENLSELKHELSLAKNELEELKDRQTMAEKQVSKYEEERKEAKKVKLELMNLKLELEHLKEDSLANANASMQSRAMHGKLYRYPQLLEENEALKRENKLLVETAQNTEVLNEQVASLTQDLSRAQDEAAEGKKAQQDLIQAKKRIHQWEMACLQLLTPQERLAVGNEYVGLDVFIQKVAHLQQDRVMCLDEIQTMQQRLHEETAKVVERESQIETLQKNLDSEKSNLSEHANLIRRLKRKLLLVSKERDSYKGVLDSYEHELTITGGQFDQDRAAALQKIIDSQANVLEDLENQLQNQKSSGGAIEGPSADLISELKSLKEKVRRVEHERDELRFEMEKRSIRGDYNPSHTKVLHFKNNPVSQAQDELSVNLSKLQQENEALKARIKLLEEGQTKDLTILVGQKVEEGTSEQEVNELKEKIRSSETAKQRLIEAFKKTSQDFREACCQLTGYKVDGLPNQQYRLSPIYAESPNDYLLFKRETSGECHVLETQFLSQHKDLLDLHLRRQNSIPVFCAAVIMELFSRQTFETVASTEEDDDDEQGEEEQEHGEEEQEEEQEVEEEEDGDGDDDDGDGDDDDDEVEEVGDDDDPICID